MDKRVYFFGGGAAEGRADMKDLLGGKGANLAEMTNAGVPVPPGFTISTRVCNDYERLGGTLPDDYAAEQKQYVDRLETLSGKKLGHAEDPLLVSVRSGAKFSMPGMMDTILNLGLNDRSVLGLAARTKNERFAWDSYRRFIQMFGSVVMEIEKRAVRVRAGEAEEGEGRASRHGADRRRPEAARADLRSGRQARAEHRVSPGPLPAARHGARRRLPQLGQPPREVLPQAEPHPGRPRHRRQRAGDGLRQHGHRLRHRRRLHAQPRHGRARVLRRVPDERAGRGRGGRHPHAAADRAAEGRDAGGVRPAARDHDAAWRSTTATSRTSSSRSSAARSTCCRRAPASAPARRRCASPWRWRRKG